MSRLHNALLLIIFRNEIAVILERPSSQKDDNSSISWGLYPRVVASALQIIETVAETVIGFAEGTT
jgi:hypothetical protein